MTCPDDTLANCPQWLATMGALGVVVIVCFAIIVAGMVKDLLERIR